MTPIFDFNKQMQDGKSPICDRMDLARTVLRDTDQPPGLRCAAYCSMAYRIIESGPDFREQQIDDHMNQVGLAEDAKSIIEDRDEFCRWGCSMKMANTYLLIYRGSWEKFDWPASAESTGRFIAVIHAWPAIAVNVINSQVLLAFHHHLNGYIPEMNYCVENARAALKSALTHWKQFSTHTGYELIGMGRSLCYAGAIRTAAGLEKVPGVVLPFPLLGNTMLERAILRIQGDSPDPVFKSR